MKIAYAKKAKSKRLKVATTLISARVSVNLVKWIEQELENQNRHCDRVNIPHESKSHFIARMLQSSAGSPKSTQIEGMRWALNHGHHAASQSIPHAIIDIRYLTSQNSSSRNLLSPEDVKELPGFAATPERLQELVDAINEFSKEIALCTALSTTST